jgi:CheY-like chemotaxis protein
VTAEEPISSEAPADRTTGSDVRPHILVIDDEDQVRGAMVRVLQRLGYDATGVVDGEAGLRYVRAQPADLVITDMQMPGKSGIEVLLELRALEPGLPVIAVSGGDSSKQLDLLGSAGLLGAVAVVMKPYTVEELAEAVRGALGTEGA